MPDTYANPYAYNAPIGDAFANFSRSILSGPTQAQQILTAEQALKLKREREALGSLSDVFGMYGQPGFDRNAAMSDAILGGYDPQHLSDLERYGAANTYGATDPRTTNAFVGAGGAYGNSAAGFGQTLAETTRNNTQQSVDRRYGTDTQAGVDLFKFNNTPKEATVDGRPAFVPQSGAFATNVQPIIPETDQKGLIVRQNWGNLGSLDQQQQRYLFGNPTFPTLNNYVAPDGTSHITYDGVTDAQTGQLLPQGGVSATGNNPNLISPTVRGNLQGQTVANANLSATLKSVRDAVTSAPDVNFGATGFAKTIAQNATILATNVATGLGFKAPEDALAAIQQQAAAAGISPDVLSGIFDPRLGAMETAYGLLVYQAAGALAGQQGRGVSDADVRRAQAMVGDPTGLLSNKQTLLSKLDALETQLNINQGTVNQFLRPGGVTPAAPAAPVAPVAPKAPVVLPGQQTSLAPRAQPGVISAVTNQPTRVANSQGYGDHLTGAMTVNGHTYQWGSGGGGRGSIPFGDYHVQDYMTGAQRAAAGYEFKRDSFMLSDTKDPLIPGQAPRTGLLIHDSAAGYTAGCIGIQGDFKQFEQDLLSEAQKNGGLQNVIIHVGPQGTTIAPARSPAAAPATGGPSPAGPAPAAPAAAPAAAGVERYERGPDGKLHRVQ